MTHRYNLDRNVLLYWCIGASGSTEPVKVLKRIAWTRLSY